MYPKLSHVSCLWEVEEKDLELLAVAPGPFLRLNVAFYFILQGSAFWVRGLGFRVFVCVFVAEGFAQFVS